MKKSTFLFDLALIALNLGSHSLLANTPWWDSQWLYRLPNIIENSSTQTLTDYQVLVTVNTASLIASGKIRTDGGDIRFTDNAGNFISYYIESGMNTTETKIWIKIPSIPPSGTGKNYLYYGNPNALSKSNGDNTFDFFDHFDGSQLDLGKWHIINPEHGVVEVSNSLLHMKNTIPGYWQYAVIINSNNPVAINPMLFELVGLNIIKLGYFQLLLSDDGAGYGSSGVVYMGYTHTWCRLLRTGTWEDVYFTYAQTKGQLDLSLWIHPDGLASLLINDMLRGTSINPMDMSLPCIVTLRAGTGDTPWAEFYLDQVRLRKYIEPEPICTPGQEELNIVIDIKPESNSNKINPKSHGLITVAILTTSTSQGDRITFDATDVDPLTVAFGPGNAKMIHGKSHIEDIDTDGDADMILHFRTQETGIISGATEASLFGKTCSGQSLVGSDNVQIVKNNLLKKADRVENSLPDSYEWYQNYPNPFNNETIIEFQLPEQCQVRIEIYDVLGHQIRTLVNDMIQAGYHIIIWDGNEQNGFPVSSGIYICRIQAGEFVSMNKMTLLR